MFELYEHILVYSTQCYEEKRQNSQKLLEKCNISSAKLTKSKHTYMFISVLYATDQQQFTVQQQSSRNLFIRYSLMSNTLYTVIKNSFPNILQYLIQRCQ